MPSKSATVMCEYVSWFSWRAISHQKVLTSCAHVSWRVLGALLVNAVPLRLELADDVAALIAAEQLDAVLLRLDPVLTQHTDTLSATNHAAKKDKALGSGFLLRAGTVSFAELLAARASGQEREGARIPAAGATPSWRCGAPSSSAGTAAPPRTPSCTRTDRCHTPSASAALRTTKTIVNTFDAEQRGRFSER